MFDYIPFSKFNTHNGDDTLPRFPDFLLDALLRSPSAFYIQCDHYKKKTAAI
jgi:hypothetical protein